MSYVLYSNGNLTVGRYCGPALADPGADRTRWQFTIGDAVASVARGELDELLVVLQPDFDAETAAA